MENILEYLKQTYAPLSIIVYGSYANGTNSLNSDFDALVITDQSEHHHDTSRIDGIPLDVFVYPSSFFEGDFDCEAVIQIFDGLIVLDHDGLGQSVQNRVLTHLENRLRKTENEMQSSIDWCIKMAERARRDDAEGLFRWHWVLIDSLEIFCDLMQQPYFGPKKALKWMEQQHPDAFACYERALHDFSPESLSTWISCIQSCRSERQ